jgi:MFS family permease
MSNLYKKFLKNYYLASCLYDFVFAYAIYNVLFSLRGLSVFQISLLLAWWALVAALLEIPTGGLADTWSRKKMLTIAPMVKSLCFITWFLANGNFYLYALGFVFWALGSSFVSGTTEALLYDTLKHHGKIDEYEKVLGRKKFYFNFALAIASISGGFIANFNIDLAVILSVIPLLLSAFFASLLPEVPKVESTGVVHYFECIKAAFHEIRSSKVLRYIFIYLLAISIFWDLEEFDQLYYQLVKLPLYAFGIIGFLLSALNAIGAYFAHKFKGGSAIFYTMPVIGGLLLILVFKYPTIPMIGLLMLSYLITTPLKILMESNLQHNIKTDSRATVTSACNLLLTLFGVLITVVFGLVSKIWNFQTIYLATAVFLFVFALWVFSVRNEVVVKNANGSKAKL